MKDGEGYFEVELRYFGVEHPAWHSILSKLIHTKRPITNNLL
jgi:hypothetical protein